MNCPCGTGKNFDECCAPFIAGQAFPPTPELLMRSRYTAFTRGEMEYIQTTLAPESREDFDVETTRTSAEKVKWKELRIVAAAEATVEFVAVYEHDGQNIEHHEVSRFRRDDADHWLYVEGDILSEPAVKTVTRAAPKVGRNDPCTCGSGKKFKKCCGA